MRYAHILMLSGSVILSIVGCDGNDPNDSQAKTEGDHVWKGQTQHLETARGVAKDLESQQSAMDDRLRGVTRNNQ